PLRDHFSVHDRDVHKQEEDHKEVVHETQKSKKRFGENVERRGQVGNGTDETEKNSNPEHPEESAHRKHLPEGMTEQGGDVTQSIQKLTGVADRKNRRDRIL
ncbi:hypothetical protein GOODEAATRI_024363, partial [Goodea atripinnis]